MAAARVLVIDDEPQVLHFLTHALNRSGYEAVPASGPREALEILRCQPAIDVVLSDITMPEMPGTWLVQEIARAWPDTACVLMTGGAVEEEAELPPGVPLLRKPMPVPDLLAAIEEALAHTAQLRAALRKSLQECAQLQEQSRQLISDCRDLAERTAETLRKAKELRNRKP